MTNFKLDYEVDLLKKIIAYIRREEKVSLKDVCVEFDLYTREAHKYLAILFAAQKIRPHAYSTFVGAKRVPVVYWVPTKGKIQNLSPDSVAKKAQRKKGDKGEQPIARKPVGKVNFKDPSR